MVSTNEQIVIALVALYILSQKGLGIINVPVPKFMESLAVKLTSPLAPGASQIIQTYTPSNLQLPMTVNSSTGVSNIVLPASRPLVQPGNSYNSSPFFKGAMTMGAGSVLPVSSVAGSTNLGSRMFDRSSDSTRLTSSFAKEPVSINYARAQGKDQITYNTPAVMEQIRPAYDVKR